MEALLISLAVVAIICILVWYCTRLLPPPWPLVGKVIAFVGAGIWLLTHVRAIITAIANA